MSAEIPTKRRRGGQPGNQNAKNNRGGRGWPRENQYARKNVSRLSEDLARLYPGQIEWILEHRAALDSGELLIDRRDCALFASFIGRTPEWLVKKGLEFRIGWYDRPKEIGEPDDSVSVEARV